MVSSHQIEPEVLRPGPRPVRKRQGHQQGFGCIRLFIVPHMIVGAGLFLTALLATAVYLFGQWVPGQITGRHTSDGEDGTSYYLEYSYRIGGTDYQASTSVMPAQYDSYQNGTSVWVRVFPLVPQKGTELNLPEKNIAKHALLMWGFALFWNLILFAFVWAIYILPVRTRAVVASGVPALGHIVHKQVISGEDSDTHLLYYEFSPASTPSLNRMQGASPQALGQQSVQMMAPLKGKLSVTHAEYSQAHINDVVTVLYSPKNPKRSVIYRYADYEIVC